MGKIDYRAIYEENHNGWRKMTDNPGKYEALLAGHYSDNNHFIYELIQNAEDAGAACVVFEYYDDKICFYHDGNPFDEADVIGVSSMLETTKADDAQTIGKFGMGFKSVFKYTCEPEIYTDEEAFRIKNYLLPEEIQTDWDYKYEMCKGLKYSLNGEIYVPFNQSEHLTKVVLPFQKREKTGAVHRIDGSDIVLKLKELEPEILLFLKHIKSLFWIDVSKKKYERFVLIDQDDSNLKVCQLKGNAVSTKPKRYEDLYFYKYIRDVHHAKMGNAQVSLAFQTNSQQKSIQKVDNSDIWVFFPTKDRTTLPCLLHGSFETAVSREKLMRPSEFNDTLIKAAVELFSEAVLDFQKRGLITQSFIRQILVPAFNDSTLRGLKKSMTELFALNSLLPARDDKLVSADEACIAVPFDLVDLSKNELFKDSFSKEKEYVMFNDEKSAGFSEYYSWLKDDLKVSVYSVDVWAKSINKKFENYTKKANYDLMQDFYEFLDEYKLSEYTKESGRKKSAYEEDVQLYIKRAWNILKTSKVLINAENDFVAAYNEKSEEQVYLSSTSEYHKIAKTAIVLLSITENYKTLLEDSFGVREFDNFEYVKGQVLVKYSHTPKAIELNDDFVREYADDILQVCRLMMTSSYLHEVQELIADRCIIMARTNSGELQLMRSRDVYKGLSVEGADLTVYYAEIGKQVAFLETEFYNEKGISIDSIIKLGVHTTPIEEGPKNGNGIKAIGDFRPFLEFKYLRKNIEYIQEHSYSDLAKKKSACILKIALENASKMVGKVIIGSDENFETRDGISKTLEQLRKDDWLYSDGELCYIEDISKNQLDKKIYQEIELSRFGDQCRLLGFAIDETEQTFDGIANLDKDAKQQLLTKLAKELGVDISVKVKDGEDTVFHPDEFDMNEFPAHYVVNRERLDRYIENQFYAADPVRYKEVVVRQRSTGNRQISRSYVMGMYTNRFGKIICQSCRRIMTANEIYAVEIANFGIEMEQLRLCLCPNCYQRYEAIKKTRSDEYVESVRRAIIHTSIANKEPYYKIDASKDMSLFFTQTHLAEIQNIIQLLDKYGVPMKENEVQTDNGDKFSGGKIDEIVVHDGEMIEYETMKDMKKHKVELDVDSYRLHKAMDGRPIGVVFEFEGQKYRITQKF